MLRVPMVQARPGMVLAVPIIHPQHPDTILLRKGFALEDHAIARLRKLNLAEFWIEYPGLEFIDRYICPRILQSRGVVAYEIRTILGRMSGRAETRLDYRHYRSTLRDFVRTLSERPSAALMIESMIKGDRSLGRQISDVCYLSLLLGMKLENYLVLQRRRLPDHRAKDVVNLGVAAMFYDIGMLALEPNVTNSWIASGCDESHAAWRKHVFLGHERVRRLLSASANAAILHHHQHYDGSGFPARKNRDGQPSTPKGDEIHIFARILMAADLFDRLTHPPGAVEDVPNVRALKQMQEPPYRDWIDPYVLRALLAVAPAYPPGTQVTLSTGEHAVVVEWSPADPCRPVVQLLPETRACFEENPQRYDLSILRDRTIIHANGRDVAQDNFYPDDDADFLLPPSREEFPLSPAA